MITQEAPEGAQVLDLQGARVARQEARVAAGEPNPVVKISAGFIELKAEVDVLAVEDFEANNLRAAFTKMLADPEDIEPLIQFGLSSQDAELLIDFIVGKSLGEASASSTPLPGTGISSRPTSPASTTEPISDLPVTGPTVGVSAVS